MPSDPQVTIQKGSPKCTFTSQVVPWGLYGARTQGGSTYRVASAWPHTPHLRPKVAHQRLHQGYMKASWRLPEGYMKVTWEKGTDSGPIVRNTRPKHEFRGVKMGAGTHTNRFRANCISCTPSLTKTILLPSSRPCLWPKTRPQNWSPPKLHFSSICCPRQTQENQVSPK